MVLRSSLAKKTVVACRLLHAVQRRKRDVGSGHILFNQV